MAKSFEVKKPPRRGGTFYPSSFSFLFRRKEKQKEAKRKEKPDKSIYLKVAGAQAAKMVNFQKVPDILRKTPVQHERF